MSSKREHEGSDTEDDWIGPLPSEAAPQKKQRGFLLQLMLSRIMNIYYTAMNGNFIYFKQKSGKEF